MSNFSWIMSAGGPLICLETRNEASWGGIETLSVEMPGAMTDYDRACEGLSKALTSAPLRHGAALFFQGPFDTSFWRRSRDGKVFVIRIEACAIDTDFEQIMEGLNETIFEKPLEALPFDFKYGDLTVFDSAEEGIESAKKSIKFKINPGKYEILSCFFETGEFSLLLHRFDQQN